MTFTQRLLNGLRLLHQSLMVVWRDRTLLAFPMLSTGITLVLVWLFYMSVGPNKLQLLVNIQPDGSINSGHYVVVFVTYLMLYFVTLAANAALAQAAYVSMTERDAKFRDGMRAGLRSVISLILWSLFNSTIGVLFSLLDQQKNTSRLLRSVLHSGWTLMTYFVVPIVVIERKSIFAALPRSGQILTERWGESVSAQVSTGWFLALLNLPVVLFLFIEWYTTNLSAFIFLLSFSWVIFAIILATTAKQVLTVVLYLYAANGEAPKGWDPEALRHTFAGTVTVPPPAAEAPTAEAIAASMDGPDIKS